MAAAIRQRVADFCTRYNLRLPILLAPMAGACPPSLSIAVANAGGLNVGDPPSQVPRCPL